MKHLDLTGDLNVPVQGEVLNSPPKREPDFKPTVALKPGIDWDGESEIEVTSEVYAEPVADWDTLLSELGYDSNLYEIVEPVKISAWDTAGEDSHRLYSYKAGVRAKREKRFLDDDRKDLIELIRKHRPMKTKPMSIATGSTMLIFLADWQLGKADGYGTQGTVEAILEDIEEVSIRITELNKLGRNITKLIICGMGDMVENCDGHYASQTFTVELNRREQVRVLRRLLTKAITTWAKLVPEVEIYCVPGNHGENRKDGKAYTTRGDNDDVAAFEMVAEILAFNQEAYGHVSFFVPEDEVYMTFQAGEKIVAIFHGHITGGGSDPQKKIRDWWKDHSFAKSRGGIRDAHILVTAHYHHFSVIEYDEETIHIQCPTRDGGSEWFGDMKGVDSRSGTLTFLIDDSGKPFRDLEIA